MAKWRVSSLSARGKILLRQCQQVLVLLWEICSCIQNTVSMEDHRTHFWQAFHLQIDPVCKEAQYCRSSPRVWHLFRQDTIGEGFKHELQHINTLNVSKATCYALYIYFTWLILGNVGNRERGGEKESNSQILACAQTRNSLRNANKPVHVHTSRYTSLKLLCLRQHVKIQYIRKIKKVYHFSSKILFKLIS